MAVSRSAYCIFVAQMGIFMLCAVAGFGQKATIKGRIVNEKNEPMPFAQIALLNTKDSTVLSGVNSQENGVFELKTGIFPKYLVRISYLNYQTLLRVIDHSATTIETGDWQLTLADNYLNEVVVKGDKTPVGVKKDTLEFDATVLKPMPNDNLEDLIKKVPTLEMDENGGIKTQNKTVRKLLIDGKEFFGNDPNIALKNLPADAIEKIQVIEKMNEQAEFSGVDDGEREVIINVTLKKSHKRGIVGFAAAGVAPPIGEKPAFYNLKTSINRFTTDHQFSVLGLLNNVNQQGFTPQDVSNFTSLNRQNSRNVSSNPNSNVNLPVVVGTRPGIISTQGIGANYNNQYDKNSSLQSSYFYTAGQTDLVRNMTRQSFLPNRIINTVQQSNQLRNNTNHRLNATLNHEFNKFNTIRLVVGLNTIGGNFESKSNTQNTTTTNDKTTETSTLRQVLNNSGGISNSNSLMYRHRFEKIRRALVATVTYNFSQDQNYDSTNTIFNTVYNNLPSKKEIFQINDRHTDQQNQRLQLSYNEPIGKELTLETSYSIQRNINNADYKVWDIVTDQRKLNTQLSNLFRNNFIFQQTGLKLNLDKKEKTFVAGVQYQKSVLNSFFNRGADMTLSRTFENVLPSARFSLRKGNGYNTSLEYNTAVNEPSVRDLQPITINNNPQYISVGNPDLKPEYSHRINWSQNFFNPKTFTTFNGWGSFNYTLNAFGQSQTVSETLVRTTKPVNMPYRWNTAIGLTYSFSFGKTQKNRVRFSLMPRWSISQGNSLVNGVNNLNNQTQWRGEGRMTYLTDKLNVVFSTNYQKSFIEYSVNQEFNQNFEQFSESFDFRWKFHKNSSITTSFDYTMNQNSRNTNANIGIPIWNLGFKQLFLKNNKGELSLMIQDVLNRNIYLYQRSYDNVFEVERANTLGQYFMLNFTYNIRKQGKLFGR